MIAAELGTLVSGNMTACFVHGSHRCNIPGMYIDECVSSPGTSLQLPIVVIYDEYSHCQSPTLTALVRLCCSEYVLVLHHDVDAYRCIPLLMRTRTGMYTTSDLLYRVSSIKVQQSTYC